MRRIIMCCCFILAGSVACAGNDAALSVVCGNGRLNYGEACDGDVFSFAGPLTCSELGYNSPVRLACTSTCALDHSPCVASGVCGDGFVTPGWEACDGKDNAGQTCESLGHHAGRLFCHADCTFDVSLCERCGDGLVQPEFGERFESGSEYCLESGHLGGYILTEDCVTATLDRCGEYALIAPAGSLLEPMAAPGPGGEILIHGLTTGAFPGFTHPRPECPRLQAISDAESVPARVLGWRHDHTCVQEFRAGRAPGQEERILDEGPVEGRVLQLQALGDGWIVLRLRQEMYELVRLDSTGAEVAVHPILLDGLLQPPRLQRLPGGFVGMDTVDGNGLRLWVLDAITGAPVERLSLGGVMIQVQDAPIPESRVFPISLVRELAWLGEDEWLMRVGFDYQYSRNVRLIHVVEVAGAAKVKVLDPILNTTFSPFSILGRDEASGGGTLTWLEDARRPRVKRTVFQLTGEVVTSHQLELPEGAYLEALGSDGAGGALVFGTVPVKTAVEPWPPQCPGAERAFAFWHLGPGLEVREARFFPSVAANHVDETVPDYCALDERDTLDIDGTVVHALRRSYTFQDGTLIVAGAYDTAVGFCDEGGGRILHEGDGLPVHACGVYLLRFR